MLRLVALAASFVCLWPALAMSLDRSLLLTWTNPAENTDNSAGVNRTVVVYDVGWSLNPGPPYTLSTQGDADGIRQFNTDVVDGSALSHLLRFSDLTAGMALYFAVRGCNANNQCGEWSTEVVHIVIDDAELPAHKPDTDVPLLRIVNKDFTLLWGNPDSNTGNKDVQFFVLGVADTPGGPYELKTVPASERTHAWQFPDAQPGDEKYFVVQACNGNGVCSDWSAEAGHVVPDTDADNPAPPTFLMVIFH